MSWQLAGSVAWLKKDNCSIHLDIKRPDRGLQVESMLGVAAPAIQSLCFTAVPSSDDGYERIEEAYIRGNDLIVCYDELPDRDVRPTSSWSDLDLEPCVAAIELRLFMQTRRLQSHAEIHLATRYPASATTWSLVDDQWQQVARQGSPHEMTGGLGAFLVRLPGLAVTYAEFMYPSDFHGARYLTRPGAGGDIAQLEYCFFCEPLEKGVVRVGRVWSVWLAREGDEQSAVQQYHRLCESQLPLTV